MIILLKFKTWDQTFFLDESNLGTPRSTAILPKLQELNGMTTIRAHYGDLTEEIVSAHNVIVLVNASRDTLLRWNDFCHERKIGFIASDTKGFAGYAFSDFGDGFVIRDATGENPITRIITHITNDAEGIVSLLGADGEEEGKMHGLDDNDHDGWVEISDVEGMTSESGGDINTSGPYRIKMAHKRVKVFQEREGKKVEVEKEVFDPYRLKIGDLSGFSQYINGGVLTQVKRPITQHYRSFRDNIIQPIAPGQWGLSFTDGAKFGRGEQLHFAFLAIWEFEARHGRHPQVCNEEEAQQVLAFAKEINESHKKMNEGKEEPVALALEELDEVVILNAARYASIDFQPLGAFFGGVVAQEVVKFTGKFTPLNQQLYIDCFEVIPETKPTDTELLNSRYDHLIAAFGKAFHEKIQNARTFLVGCGALGCEFLKNFALIGLATGENGLITVTDNDRIEVSNLNRQFLFREKNVGQPKSIAASAAVLAMNPSIKIDAKETLVAPHTENIFVDEFWENLDFVTNALDNIKARQYVDGRCVYYAKPLLESGTLGTKCNVQVVIPHMTASYTDGPKDGGDEDQIPMCTLRNFPSLIEHCIEWSRAQFEDMFVVPAAEAQKFAANKQEYLKDIRSKTIDHLDNPLCRAQVGKELPNIKSLATFLRNAQGITFEECIKLSVKLFNSMFRDRILQLIHNFPENHVTSSGERFWSGAKRFPQAAHLDLNDEQHLNYIISVSNLLAVNFGLVQPPEDELVPEDHQWRNVEYFKSVLQTISIEPWTATDEKVDLSEGTNEKAEDTSDTEVKELEALLNELSRIDVSNFHFEPASFEKDEDLNFHIDFIASSSNLRASNYRIRQTTRHKCKMIAGKIIPAIATATASVTGLVTIELFKLLQNKPLSAYKDASNNLAVNIYNFLEPAEPEKSKDEYDPIEMAEIKCRPSGFTKWDKTVIHRGDLTLREFLNVFNEQTSLNVTVLLHSSANHEGPQKGKFLYESLPWRKDLKELYDSKLDTRLRDWIAELYPDVMVPNRRYIELEVSCADDQDQTYRVPTVIYKFA